MRPILKTVALLALAGVFGIVALLVLLRIERTWDVTTPTPTG